MLRMTALLTCLLGLAVASAAGAKGPEFGPMPMEGNKKSSLKMRVVTYQGGTNGKMMVEVKNTTQAEESFHAKGLYFVPKGDPEKAPQRLGAAGPFEAKKNGQ